MCNGIKRLSVGGTYTINWDENKYLSVGERIKKENCSISCLTYVYLKKYCTFVIK